MHRIGVLLVAASLVGSADLHAQRPTGRVHFEWNAVNMVLLGDSVGGVTMWAGSTVAAERAGGRPSAFVDRFHPAELKRWLPYVDSLFALGPVRAGDHSELRATPVLVGLNGGRVVLARRREGDRWHSRLFWQLATSDTASMMLATDARQGRQFREGLGRMAVRSDLREPHLAPDRIAPDSASCPQWGSPVHSPTWRLMGKEFWATVVVDTTGRPMLDSYQAVVVDDTRMTTSVFNAVRSTRFPSMPQVTRIYLRYRF